MAGGITTLTLIVASLVYAAYVFWNFGEMPPTVSDSSQKSDTAALVIEPRFLSLSYWKLPGTIDPLKSRGNILTPYISYTDLDGIVWNEQVLNDDETDTTMVDS